MSNSSTVNRNSGHPGQVRQLLWPVAIIVFLFTVSYPAIDVFREPREGDEYGRLGIGMFLIYAGIALLTTIIVFALVLPGALRRESSGGVALTLAIVGTLLASGFWTGFPPASAAGGALLGWAGINATKGRRLSQAALVIGVLGLIFNVVSYAVVFI